jgi:hypothetical protein
LGRKPKHLSLRKWRRDAIDRLHNAHPSLPHTQVAKVADLIHYTLPTQQPAWPLAPEPRPLNSGPYPACSATFIKMPNKAKVLSRELPP